VGLWARGDVFERSGARGDDGELELELGTPSGIVRS
jgi:hypothetical protein